jgi:hypothetical protein
MKGAMMVAVVGRKTDELGVALQEAGLILGSLPRV